MPLSRTVRLLVVFLLVVGGSKCDLDIGFVIEEIEKNAGDNTNWNNIANFVVFIIKELPRWCTRIGITKFDLSSTTSYYKSRDPHAYLSYILRSTPRGSDKPKSLSFGLDVTIEELLSSRIFRTANDNVLRVAIVIMFHESNNITKSIEAAREFRRRGIKVISVGTTEDVHQHELVAISSPPHKAMVDYFMVQDYGSLKNIQDSFVENLKLLDEATVRLHKHVDIGFIIAIARSDQGTENWDLVADFMDAFLSYFPTPGTQVGVVTCGNPATVVVHLDSNMDLCDSRKEIRDLPSMEGHSNRSGGLYITDTQLFNVRDGDRPDVQNVAVLITDSSEGDIDMTLDIARKLHQERLRVITIGVTQGVNEQEIRETSSPPHKKNEDYFLITDYHNLRGIIDVLIVSIGQQMAMGKDKGPSKNPQCTSDSLTKIVIIVVPVAAMVILITLIIGCVLYRKTKNLPRNTGGNTIPTENGPGDNGKSADQDDYVNHPYDVIPANTHKSTVETDSNNETPPHAYQNLTPGYKSPTFESWLKRNNISKTIAVRLKKQKIRTTKDLQLMTPENINNLGLTMGDANRLRDALMTL